MDEALARVLDQYRLGTLRSVQRIERGFVDESWLVETEIELNYGRIAGTCRRR